MRQKREYKYRFYPTPEQVSVLARTFGSARFVDNWALRMRTDAYYERQERISYADTSAALTALKREPETAWLNEVSSVPPQQALRHLGRAFRHFFEGRAKYPTVKKKRERQSAEYTTSAFRWDAEKCSLTLAKMEAPRAIVWSRAFTGDPTTVTVTRDPAGRYFVSFLAEEEIAPLPPTATAIGLDMGVSALVTLSTGEKITNPKHFARSRCQLKTAQKRLARRQNGSKNREKARLKVARTCQDR
jgi:putative transposase